MHILEHGALKYIYDSAKRIAVVDHVSELKVHGIALPRCRICHIQIEVKMTNCFVRPQRQVSTAPTTDLH